ncbi:hypothetical protein LCGC14_1152790 [marine sediment metagenome]|uniref:site-specific DNA-methyltransferase (cytosine-N(4)-specific) n=1 Tax=marine sediment metagenome TaxID=412755 RepID=A0A0F9PD55_9ZZZZ
MTVEIIHADAREALAAMPEGSVHCAVTSPPYWGLRDYGLEPVVWGGAECEHEWSEESYQRRSNDGGDGARKQETNAGAVGRDEPIHHAFCRRCNAWRGSLGLEPTPELYVEHIVQVMREVRRVLRDDATLWLNLGDSYASQPSWGRGGGSTLGGGVPHSAGTQRNLNGLKPKDLCGMPWRVAFALQADGWWLRSDIVWSKPNPMPESVTDRPTRSHEYVFLLSKSARYAYDADAIREPLAEASIARISQPTFNQQQGGPKDYGNGTNPNRSARRALENLAASHKGSRFDRGKTAEHQLGRASSGQRQDNPAGRNKRSVWEIATQPSPLPHYAVFPEKLVEPCILAGTSEWGCCPECAAPWERVVEVDKTQRVGPSSRGGNYGDVPRDDGTKVMQGGYEAGRRYMTTDKGWRPTCKHEAEPVPCTVLDPFAGSGTVGLVAERLGRHSVLIDANEDYVKMARERTAQMGLMEQSPPH